MPVTLPNLEFCKSRIDNNCDVIKAKLVAVAFESSGAIITDATNRTVVGCVDKWTIHAEDFLVKKLSRLRARERYKKIHVLVVRWSEVNAWSMAKPCVQCENILRKYGIDRIFYTNITGGIEELKCSS